jgi:RNA polymerase sigma-70 factor (ECF subfamily)
LSRHLKLVSPPAARAGAVSSAPAPRSAFAGTDADLVEGLRRGDPGARAALYDRHADHVHHVLCRTLGFDRELADLHHDVFVRALTSLHRLEDPSALKGWLTMIAVHVARSAISRRKRRSWLWFLPGDELPEVEAGAASGEVLDAFRATYAILDRLPSDERIAFALRFIDGMELTEVAAACGTSLATIKRRLARAGARFEAGARRHPALAEWLEGGTRWGSPSDR